VERGAASSIGLRYMFTREIAADSVRVRLHAASVRAIEHEVGMNSTKIETGGILLGTRAVTDFDVVLAGDAGQHAVRAPRYFLRDLDHARELAASAWTTHGAQWVGEWHTHPMTALEPSRFDISTYRKHLADTTLNFDVFIALLVRPASTGLKYVAWAVDGRSVARVQLDFV
jgi:integrative and conjugative element protein (TIGR02256 family)